jgi:hypothetical protein
VIASVPAHLTKDKETMDQIKDQMDLERGIGTTVHPE